MCCKPCVIGGHHSIFSRRLAWLERPILGGYVRLHANHAEKLSCGLQGCGLPFKGGVCPTGWNLIKRLECEFLTHRAARCAVPQRGGSFL